MTDFQFNLLTDWLQLSPVFKDSIDAQRVGLKFDNVVWDLERAIRSKMSKFASLPTSELSRRESIWFERAKLWVDAIEKAT